MYLAAIADAQPQPPAMPAQVGSQKHASIFFSISSFLYLFVIYVSTLAADGSSSCDATSRILHAAASSGRSSNGSTTGSIPPKDANAVQ